MTSIPLLRLVLAAALALPVPVAAATPPPIATPAALARYLHDMPPGRSPLDAFSPGARKRFLAQLRFGREGLGGFSTDDLAHELGLMNPVSRRVWKALRIDGRPSRFRSEPAAASSSRAA